MRFLERLLTPTTLQQAIVTAAILLAFGYVLGMFVKQSPKYAFILCLLIGLAIFYAGFPGAATGITIVVLLIIFAFFVA